MQTGSPVSRFILLDSNFIPEVIIDCECKSGFLFGYRVVSECQIWAKTGEVQSVVCSTEAGAWPGYL